LIATTRTRRLKSELELYSFNKAPQMDYANLIDRIYEHVENDHVEKATLTCLRLARVSQDYLSAAIFLRELYSEKQQFSRIFAEDTRNLKEEAIKYLHQKSFDIWIDARTLPFNLSDEDDDQRKVLVFGIGDIESNIVQLQRSIDDLIVPPGMAAFDTAAFTDSYTRKKELFRLHIKGAQIIRNRIKARCYNYAVSIEKQLQAQQKPEAFLHQVQRQVNNYFNARSEDVYTKLQKAAELADSTNAEDYALLLTSVRRAMKAAADHFYPPVSDPVTCSDGKQRKLSDEQYLNRLEEFVATALPSGTSSDLVRAELAFLTAFARRLNDISSKGVHADVSDGEAKQGLVGLYMFLYNLIGRLQTREQAYRETAVPRPAARQ
jgi:hypothetical protein